VTVRLAAVYAHPDDDVYGIGGLIALERERLDLTVIVATRGEAGLISDPSLATREDLGAVREREERDALAALGMPGADLHFLGYGDGELEAVDRGELVGRIEEILRRARPDVVVTFGPEGITHHPDHITVGQAATDAFHRARAAEGGEAAGSFRRLFYNAVPQSELDRVTPILRERGIDMGNPGDPNVPQGVPDHTISVALDVGPVIDRKIAGIRAHRTQAVELGALPEDLQREMFSSECFVRAWPPVTEPAGSLGDAARHPFDGL
jgi:LmbE family N-acetylglucosaminyl deacetylase